MERYMMKLKEKQYNLNLIVKESQFSKIQLLGTNGCEGGVEFLPVVKGDNVKKASD
ncbi:MAG: hypothetical protein GXZ06_09915 [Tissierellia bacterium]|nr:hypothetical protein [Tissierellia bacterium]